MWVQCPCSSHPSAGRCVSSAILLSNSSFFGTATPCPAPYQTLGTVLLSLSCLIWHLAVDSEGLTRSTHFYQSHNTSIEVSSQISTCHSAGFFQSPKVRSTGLDVDGGIFCRLRTPFIQMANDNGHCWLCR